MKQDKDEIFPLNLVKSSDELKELIKKIPTQTTKFVNYDQPIYTDEEIQAAIDRKKARRCGDD